MPLPALSSLASWLAISRARSADLSLRRPAPAGPSRVRIEPTRTISAKQQNRIDDASPHLLGLQALTPTGRALLDEGDGRICP